MPLSQTLVSLALGFLGGGYGTVVGIGGGILFISRKLKARVITRLLALAMTFLGIWILFEVL